MLNLPCLLMLAWSVFPSADKTTSPDTLPEPTRAALPVSTDPIPGFVLTESPNPWSPLHRYDASLTRAEFEYSLKNLFDPFAGLKPYMEISDSEVRIYPSATERREPQFVLPLATQGQSREILKPYRSPEEFRHLKKLPSKPLAGLRIAIDPGHIGGAWGQIEDRSTPYHGLGRIQEGDMNLITARLIKPALEELGAEVLLTRNDTEPVTSVRPSDLLDEARESYLLKRPELAGRPVSEQISAIGKSRLEEAARYLFIRKHEFMARAEKIRAFRPDITVVLYINATPSSAWSRLIGANQNIFFVHGAYVKAEAQDPRQQLRLISKLLDRATPIEYEVAASIADCFQKTTHLPPVPYMDSSTTRMVDPHNPSVVARNLGANRYYDGPVVVTEPYFMNNKTVARRLLMGDYEGTQLIDGKPTTSIFREYAGCVVEGLTRAYSQ